MTKLERRSVELKIIETDGGQLLGEHVVSPRDDCTVFCQRKECGVHPPGQLSPQGGATGPGLPDMVSEAMMCALDGAVGWVRSGWAGQVTRLCAVGLLLPLSGPVMASAVSPDEVLRAAFSRRYGLDFLAEIELVMHSRSGRPQHRLFHAASKSIDGRVHSIGRLVKPEFLRGMAILTIENEDRGHDSFLFLPAVGKVRRVTTAQRDDSFLGSDVTYEDLERPRAEEYEIETMVVREHRSEATYVLTGRSKRALNYAGVSFFIAVADYAILETHYFKANSDQPYRVVTASREASLVSDGRVFPTHFAVEDRGKGTRTEVFFRNPILDPEIDNSIFSVVALERERKIPVASSPD